jgi:hypothetical protein
MPNEPKSIKNAAKNLKNSVIHWGKNKKKKTSNAITSRTKRAKNAITDRIKKVRFTPGRNPVKANTGTKKKGFNNTKFRNEKNSKLDKLKKHIKYCKNLEKAYERKHGEVKRLTDYLSYLVTNTPDKPISKTDVIKIIDGIDNIKIPDNVEEKQQKLDKLIKIQEEWEKEYENTIKQIDTKLKTLKGTESEVLMV